MSGLPPDIGVYLEAHGGHTSERDTVCLSLSAPNGRLVRPMHLWEARALCKALVSHTCDPLTARAVCGLIGGAA